MWNCIRWLTSKTFYPVTFYAIQLLALFPQQKDFLADLEIQVAETIFGVFSLAKMGVVGLTC